MIPNRDRGFRSPPEIGHVRSESPVTLLRNDRSRSIGIVGHVPPETSVTLVRNTHLGFVPLLLKKLGVCCKSLIKKCSVTSRPICKPLVVGSIPTAGTNFCLTY